MSNSYVVRYGSTHHLGEFNCRGDLQLRRDTDVIVRSSRGVEWGAVLCKATERTRDFLSNDQDKGRILRPVSDEDRQKLESLYHTEKNEFKGCQELIAERKMQMQLVDVEHLYGGERIVFYYLAEKRVDFRELVKDLAKKYNTRIEMRQIGVRDEAKHLADYGDCGKPVCCNTHLQEMPPVSMKMAKVQKATLDPSKITGRCGRLKCCLRYEYNVYQEYQRELPKVGATVVTKQGQGKVVDLEILAKRITVQLEQKGRTTIQVDDIITVVQKKTGKEKKVSD